MNTKPQLVSVDCPRCGEECLEVTVTNGGSYPDSDFGTIYWFEGDGVCSHCGFEDFYSDSN